jgi:hypothetical protein
MFRKNIKFDKKPIKIKLNERNMKKDLIQESYSVLIDSVKQKLRPPKFSKEIPDDKSTLWKYEINLDKLKEIEEDNLTKINEKINKKEEEIIITEKDFIQYQLHDKNYIPKYIKDLSQDKMDRMKFIIDKKIKEVNLSYNKKAEIKNEIKKIEKEKANSNLSINLKSIINSSPIKTDVNIFLTPIRPIKINKKRNSPINLKKELDVIDEKPNKSLENQKILEKNNSINTDKRIKITKSLRRYNYNLKNDLIDVAHMSKEDKFREFKMQFDEKLNEIKGPMQFIKLRKKQLNI